MAEKTHWLIDEELFNKFPELKQDLIMTLVSMRAVLDLTKDDWFSIISKNDQIAVSYAKGLEKSAIHAYCKRLCDFEEYRKPESLLAILQYEFQARMMLTKTKPPETVKK